MDKVLEGLVSLLTSMIALSVGVERIVEIIKGFSPWLRVDTDPKLDPDGRKAAWRRVALQGIATLAGTAIAAAIDPSKFLPTMVSSSPSPVAFWGAAILLGLMASGGSAFWNHALDIVAAVKNTKETIATQTQAQAQQTASREQAAPSQPTAPLRVGSSSRP